MTVGAFSPSPGLTIETRLPAGRTTGRLRAGVDRAPPVIQESATRLLKANQFPPFVAGWS
jgi:hypothetical protein